MPARGFDGNDVETVVSEVRQAADRARAGEGPTFLVARTFRFRGFTMSDPLKYRTKEQAWAASERDPIRLYTSVLAQRGGLSDPARLAQLERDTTVEVNDAFELADSSPDPKLEERFDNVLSERYPFCP
jgi:pyruvate dehydrogenase E1 component alpha subunit